MKTGRLSCLWEIRHGRSEELIPSGRIKNKSKKFGRGKPMDFWVIKEEKNNEK